MPCTYAEILDFYENRGMGSIEKSRILNLGRFIKIRSFVVITQRLFSIDFREIDFD